MGEPATFKRKLIKRNLRSRCRAMLVVFAAAIAAARVYSELLKCALFGEYSWPTRPMLVL